MNDQEKKAGIDLIKKAIKALYSLTDEVIKDLKDKKISIAEVLGLSDNGFEIIMLITKLKLLKEEVLDVDSEEVQDLIQYVIDLGFLNEDAVTIISNVVTIIEKEYVIYQENVIPIIELIKIKRAMK